MADVRNASNVELDAIYSEKVTPPLSSCAYFVCKQNTSSNEATNMHCISFVTYYSCHGSPSLLPPVPLPFSLSRLVTPQVSFLLCLNPGLVVYILTVFPLHSREVLALKIGETVERKTKIMRVLDIEKMVMKWSSINGDTVVVVVVASAVVVGVFMINTFHRIVVSIMQRYQFGRIQQSSNSPKL